GKGPGVREQGHGKRPAGGGIGAPAAVRGRPQEARSGSGPERYHEMSGRETNSPVNTEAPGGCDARRRLPGPKWYEPSWQVCQDPVGTALSRLTPVVPSIRFS